eukprot:NODE_2923_length_394_cov_22.684058_g2841_i0.p2 GENE.NODE_2923_length_394_cov_22.684058_g2841_i0~~NODE_2923_length_394_cov_22.684058_g2841_i0.p2  ORF type:complete len:50 (-),score=5.07 NODE_2923_length_394_cov_22.684058_g2841_i0:212-361(-)
MGTHIMELHVVNGHNRYTMCVEYDVKCVCGHLCPTHTRCHVWIFMAKSM